MLSRAFLRLAILPVIVFATTACGGGGSDKATAPSPSSPTPTPTSPAPAALQGVWVTTLRVTGERVTLTISPNSYQVNRGTNQTNGTIDVPADQINFSNSTSCSGAGAYKWAITGTSLLFTIVADACPGRSEVLAGYTYIKG